MQDEPEFSLRDYCRMMIAVSDNMATDLLMETVGIANINEFLDELDCQTLALASAWVDTITA